jgi:hypothetical protein
MADQKSRGGQKKGQGTGQSQERRGNNTQGTGQRADRDKQQDQRSNPDDKSKRTDRGGNNANEDA